MRIHDNISFTGATRLNMFYFSDYHGDVPAYKELKTASDEFDSKHKNTQNFKLAGGDLVSGDDYKKRLLVYRLLNFMNIEASAVGNHEWDNGTNFYQQMSELHKKAPNLLFNNYISCNTKSQKLDEHKQQGLFQSKVITKNGEKYGLVGVITDDYQFDTCKIDDLNKTKLDITEEIKNLKKSNPDLNKIILLSHLGIYADREIAKTVPDVDIILGGHSHTLLDGVEEDKNLFMSSKNEPVLILQAGNERYFGELTVEFDKDGKIDLTEGHKPVNTAKSIFEYKENQNVEDIEESILGDTDKIGVVKELMRVEDSKTSENPIADIEADAVLEKTGADLVMLNAGAFRAFLPAGEITKRDIEYCLPFDNNVVTVKCTGKDIMNLLNIGVKTLNHPEYADPGLFQVAGLKYTVTADKKLVDVYTVDKNGQKQSQIVDKKGDLVQDNNPAAPNEYTVALTDHVIKRYFPMVETSRDYVIKDDDKYEINKKHIIKEYESDRTIMIDYIKHNFTDKNKLIGAKTGRITLEQDKKPVNSGFITLIHKAGNPAYSLQSSTTA